MLKKTSSRQLSFWDYEIHRALSLDPMLSKVDAVLNAIPDLLLPFVEKYLDDRRKRNVNPDFGKPTTPIECVLRLLVLEALHKNCTPQDVESRTKTDLAWKGFARLNMSDRVPDYTCIIKWKLFFGKEGISALHAKIIGYLTEKKVIKGKTFRTDTTVTEANVHYPTDASLLQDSVKAITRTVEKIKKVVKIKTVFRTSVKKVKQKIYEIAHFLKRRTGETKKEINRITENITRITEQVINRTTEVVKEISSKRVKGMREKLKKQMKTAKQIVKQTREVLKGIKPTGRIVSFFQPWVRPVAKGKMSVKCEFGKKVEIGETEHGIVTDWKLHIGNPSDEKLLIPAIERHKHWFGHAPSDVATDRGYWSEHNEMKAKELEIKHVSIPIRGYKTGMRKRTEHSEWFRKLQNWRAGGEAKISWLKRSFGLRRSRAKTEEGYDIGVGLGIIGCNLKVATVIC